MIDFNSHLQKFSDYVDKFGSNDPKDRENIDLKKDHSLRVYQEAKSLTQEMDFSSEYIQLARLTALYHDIGRFPQYFQYGSFNDKFTVNHGLLGFKTLRRNSFLSDLPAQKRKKVFYAVLNHNKAKIPELLPRDYAFVLQVVRDSDKLDIMNVLLQYFADKDNTNKVVTLGLNSDPEKYSKKVISSLLSGKLVEYSDLVWINDFKLMLLSWVYDFNFAHTQTQVINKAYLERILNLLPNTADIKQVEEKICTYMQSKDLFFSVHRSAS